MTRDEPDWISSDGLITTLGACRVRVDRPDTIIFVVLISQPLTTAFDMYILFEI